MSADCDFFGAASTLSPTPRATARAEAGFARSDKSARKIKVWPRVSLVTSSIECGSNFSKSLLLMMRGRETLTRLGTRRKKCLKTKTCLESQKTKLYLSKTVT